MLLLNDPAPYKEQLLALAKRSPQLTDLSDALSLAALRPHADELAARLAREVAAGSYAFTPLVPRQAAIQGKQRTLYRGDALDAIVWGVLARALASAFEPNWGSHLFSYRKGCSQWSACRSLLRYLRRHARRCATPQERGVFVVRRDVRNYGESIAVHERSSLWPTLRELLGTTRLGMQTELMPFVERAMRPDIRREDGSIGPLAVGVPTGLSLQAVACNAYLLPLDRALYAIEGGFYARFGDDLLFAHPSIEAAQQAMALIDEHVAALELSLNPRKSAHFWLTLPGRPHDTERSSTPCRRFAYLGFDVGFDGARLRQDKRRELLLSLHRRMRHAVRLLDSDDAHERVEILCSVVKDALDPTSPLSHRYAPWLRFEVMERSDLIQLDHHIALRVAEEASGLCGVRAFRNLPPRVLYQRFGLSSLVAQWDRARRPQGKSA